MTARNRASQRDFNRRRNIMLTKAFDMVFYQRGTNLSKCLLRDNPKEVETNRQQLQSLLTRQKAFSFNNFIQEKLFIETRWRNSVEPTILMERPVLHQIAPAESVCRTPHYRLPMARTTENRRQTITSLTLARPCMSNKFNIWDDVTVKRKAATDETCSSKSPSNKEKSVRFKPAIASGGLISSSDQHELFRYWFDRRVASRRDDATRHALIEQTRLTSFQKRRDPDPQTLRAISEQTALDNTARSTTAMSSRTDSIDVFLTQCHPNTILSGIKDAPTQ